MKKNTKLCLFAIVIIVILAIMQTFSVLAETEVTPPAQTQTPEENVYNISDVELPAEGFNKDKAGIYFSKYGDKTSSKYCFSMRVEKSVLEKSFTKFDKFDEYAVIKFLYREQNEENAVDEGWKEGSADIVSKSFETYEDKDYVYFVLNTYDGGLKNMTVGTVYELIFNFYEKGEAEGEKNLVCSTNLLSIKYSSDMFVSWKEYYASLSNITLEDGNIKANSFGIADIVTVPMGWLLSFFYNVTSNYLLAIILFTIVIKIILFFLTGIKQQKNMIKQAKFAPKQRAIQNKYRGRTDRETTMKMQQEIQQAQQDEGISMMGGGCLNMILQLVIIFCLYNVIRYPLTYLSSVPSGAMSVIKQYFVDFTGVQYNDISVIRPLSENFTQVCEFMSKNFNYDLAGVVTVDKLPNFELFKGFDMGISPSFSEPSLLLIVPVLVFVSYYFSMKLTRKLTYQAPAIEGAPDAAKSMAIMDIAMPALSTFICFSVPTLLGIYWIFQSVLGVAQQYILNKMYPFPKFTEEDYKAAEREYKGKQPKAKVRAELLAKKSKYDDDDEVYADLPDKVSYYDLSNEEREQVDAQMKELANKKSNTKGNNKKTGIIGKAEMNDGKNDKKNSDSNDTNNNGYND